MRYNFSSHRGGVGLDDLVLVLIHESGVAPLATLLLRQDLEEVVAGCELHSRLRVRQGLGLRADNNRIASRGGGWHGRGSSCRGNGRIPGVVLRGAAVGVVSVA